MNHFLVNGVKVLVVYATKMTYLLAHTSPSATGRIATSKGQTPSLFSIIRLFYGFGDNAGCVAAPFPTTTFILLDRTLITAIFPSSRLHGTDDQDVTK